MIIVRGRSKIAEQGKMGQTNDMIKPVRPKDFIKMLVVENVGDYKNVGMLFSETLPY